MNTKRLTMAQALIQFLDKQYISLDGKEYKFVKGILGIFGHGNVTGLGEALEFGQHTLKYIQGHNEQGMVHTATAFAKQKRRLQILACTASIGPGALNMITGAATATTNRIPVLLLPGDIFACRQPDPVLQQLENTSDYNISVNDCFKPVSKYWDRISRPEQLMAALIHAMRVLTDPVETGAVTICLPQDVQGEAYDYPNRFLEKKIHYLDRRALSKRPLRFAVEKIKSCKKPMIIAGGGIKYSLAEEALAEFADKFCIPVAVTQAGKGVLPDGHEYYVGGIGVTGTQAANRLAKECDLVLTIGTRLSDFTTSSKAGFAYPLCEFLNLNISRFDGCKMNGAILQADAKMGLKSLAMHLEQAHYQSSWEYQQIVFEQKAKWSEEVSRLYKKSSQLGIHQTAVLGVINKFVDPKDVIVCAAGSLPGDLHRLWQVKGSGSYHVEYAFSCMGYEVAGGLGVKLANPNREVYVIVGDGSFLMMHSELLTSLQENFKITIILLDNQGYQCIAGLQKAHGSKGFGNNFTQAIDFAMYAKGLGAKTFYVNNMKYLEGALLAARQESCSTLIEIKVLPDSMSGGYESWWRVGIAEVSSEKAVKQAHQVMENKITEALPY